jgi:hypothetical protein
MPPVLVPSVHAKVLAMLAVRLILGLVPVQILSAVAEVKEGGGKTVIVISVADPAHEPTVEVGVTL